MQEDKHSELPSEVNTWLSLQERVKRSVFVLMAVGDVSVVDGEGGVWRSSTPTQSELGMSCRPGTRGPVHLPHGNTGLASMSSKVSQAEKLDKLDRLAPIQT